MKEALLAYYFLSQFKEGLTKEALDKTIEQWLQQQKGSAINFEIEDALNKLIVLRLVTKHGDLLKVEALPKAISLLDERWDNYFQA